MTHGDAFGYTRHAGEVLRVSGDAGQTSPLDEDQIAQLRQFLGRTTNREIKRPADAAIHVITELSAKLEFALAFVPTEDGLFAFPDGDTWPASSRVAERAYVLINQIEKLRLNAEKAKKNGSATPHT